MDTYSPSCEQVSDSMSLAEPRPPDDLQDSVPAIRECTHNTIRVYEAWEETSVWCNRESTTAIAHETNGPRTGGGNTVGVAEEEGSPAK